MADSRETDMYSYSRTEYVTQSPEDAMREALKAVMGPCKAKPSVKRVYHAKVSYNGAVLESLGDTELQALTGLLTEVAAMKKGKT